MSRIIRINEDLSGQTLDSSLFLEGHARESLIQNCNIDQTVLLGDWRGTDYLGNTGAADWSNAQTYASYWRGNTLIGSKFPPDIGFFHHDPVSEIMRVGAEALNLTERQKVEAVSTFVRSDYITASWNTSLSLWWDGASNSKRRKYVTGFRRIFAPYPGLFHRFEELVDILMAGERPPSMDMPLTTNVIWPDGIEIPLDAKNLPRLPELSRYTLKNWFKIEADKLNPDFDHYVTLMSIFPPVAWAVPSADSWMENLQKGY